jgi:hypothetical protein
MKAIMNDRTFDEVLGGSKKTAWKAFMLVVNNHPQTIE